MPVDGRRALSSVESDPKCEFCVDSVDYIDIGVSFGACSVNPFQALMAYNETGPRISRLVHSRRLDFIYEKA